MLAKKLGLHEDIDHIMFGEEEIKAKIKELAEKLNKDYKGKNPIFVCILKGSTNFFSELTRQFNDYCEYDFMEVASYGRGMKSNGYIRMIKDLDMKITDRHVVIVEDIVDSGRTLNNLTTTLRERKPASIKIVSLLDKPSTRVCPVLPDYYGFVVPNEFVVGFGLDYAGMYRNLPYIGVLKEEVYK